jgi:SAM-dependent methyltransferase
VAFETIYRESADPWASVTRRYRYQLRKYQVVVSFLPAERRLRNALDLGCGLGALSRLIADRADRVLGLDVAQSAIDRARSAFGDHPAITFAQADLLDLPPDLNGQFDLVVIADTLYYLSPIDDALLQRLAHRVAELLAPGGLCVLVNHFFFGKDPDSALSKKIHRAFERAPAFTDAKTYWRPFYLTTFLAKVPGPVGQPDVSFAEA